MNNTTPPADLLQIAVLVAQTGARIAARRAPQPAAAKMKRSTSDLTSADDIAVETEVSHTLLQLRPHDGLLSEEGLLRPSCNGVRWILDPIDGTTNYHYRLPHWAVSVAAQCRSRDGWRTVAASVCDPGRGETFSAATGCGAWLNGQPLVPPPPRLLPEVLIAIALPTTPEARLNAWRELGRWLTIVRDIRTTGSSALDLCWVAAGRFDAFYENGIEIWDSEAGRLIVEEAGGQAVACRGALLAAGGNVDPGIFTLTFPPPREQPQ
jgi:myo-inositol-1(or 4)-monophosphatase